MRKDVIAVLTLAAIILAIIVTVSPTATLIANEVSGEVYGIDFAGNANSGDVDEVSAQRVAKKH
jgi:hypothetical protein